MAWIGGGRCPRQGSCTVAHSWVVVCNALIRTASRWWRVNSKKLNSKFAPKISICLNLCKNWNSWSSRPGVAGHPIRTKSWCGAFPFSDSRAIAVSLCHFIFHSSTPTLVPSATPPFFATRFQVLVVLFSTYFATTFTRYMHQVPSMPHFQSQNTLVYTHTAFSDNHHSYYIYTTSLHHKVHSSRRPQGIQLCINLDYHRFPIRRKYSSVL